MRAVKHVLRRASEFIILRAIFVAPTMRTDLEKYRVGMFFSPLDLSIRSSAATDRRWWLWLALVIS